MKKIGVITEGLAEQQALAFITEKITKANPRVQVLRPRFAPCHPTASARQIAGAIRSKIEDLLKKDKVETVIVLLDFENPENKQRGDHPDGEARLCPVKWRERLETVFHQAGFPQVSVVLKNRKFENWLIADVEAFKKMPKRFNLSKSFESQVVPNRADTVNDAESLINTIVRGDKYSKNKDAQKLANEQDINRAACNSRSYRRFLRAVDFPDYAGQSGKPHADCSADGATLKNTGR